MSFRFLVGLQFDELRVLGGEGGKGRGQKEALIQKMPLLC